jgi:hypothetical protein
MMARTLSDAAQRWKRIIYAQIDGHLYVSERKRRQEQRPSR